MSDTQAAARRRYFALLRNKSPEERFRLTAALIQSTRELTEVGIRRRHPDLGEGELERALAERLYGADVAQRLARRRA